MGRKRRRSGLPAFTAVSLVFLAAAAPEQFEVRLWANNESAASMPGVVATGSHPCGATATVRLTRMPPFREGSEQGPLGTELVVETGADGREAARWSLPLDYTPLALRGDALLIEHDGQRLWIGTDGTLLRDRSSTPHAPPPRSACPVPSAHPGSAYAVCARFADLSDGRSRLLQYEAPCT